MPNSGQLCSTINKMRPYADIGKGGYSTKFDMVGDKIRQIREVIGLTQFEVSEKANISRSQYIRIENNEISPRLNELSAIANVLGYEVHDLIPQELSEYEHGFVLAFRRLIFAYFRHFTTTAKEENDKL